MYDIFFLSNNEPYSDYHWEKLVKRFPLAHRINGIKGIHAAHREAASRAFTKNFWVVDADALIDDNFSFDYVIPTYDQSYVHIWYAKNPVNDLEYGYGGIKLFPKNVVLNSSNESIDFTTGLETGLKIIPTVASITAYNYDAYSSWRSAFRESVKLASSIIKNSNADENAARLDIWCSKGNDRSFGKYSIIGAKEGNEFAHRVKNRPEELKNINNFDWLKQYFLRHEDRYKSTNDMLDVIGPGMCLAKWTQTTIHLGLGQTHSCHHPKTHFIPLDEIKKNSGALHNTEFKKSIRQEMLEGKRPSECSYCWSVEDLNQPGVYSDRTYKSSENWSSPYYKKIIEAGHTQDFDPTYLEISFSNVCNFKCSYCAPSVSSKWMEEVEKFGPYPTSRNFNDLSEERKVNRVPIANREENPYIDAFWDWFPKIYKNLHTFRITGGEPLLDKNTMKLLDYIIDNPNPNIEICINSNFCVPDNLFTTFIEKVKIISNNKLIKKFLVYTSCEAHGSAAEYIRFGMNYTQWKDNCLRYINEVPGNDISIMATYNALSAGSFDKFLEDVYNMNLAADLKGSTIMIDIPYLNYPLHQSVRILTADFLPMIQNQILYMENRLTADTHAHCGFKKSEIAKLKRVKKLLEEELENPSEDMRIRRKDLSIFVDEHDKRRGTNFLQTFPEFTEFYTYCKSL